MVRRKMLLSIISPYSFFAFIFMGSSLFADLDIKPNGLKGPTLATSNPIIESYGWGLEVGLLIEQMRFFNNQAAILGITNGKPVKEPKTAGILRDVPYNFNLDPGLHVGITRYLCHDDWKFSINFDWLSAKASVYQNQSKSSSKKFWSTINLMQDFEVFKTIKGQMKVDCYLFDFILSRGSYFSRRYSFEPFSGIKACWIFMNSDCFFSDNLSTATSGTPKKNELDKVTDDFWGVGPELGFDMNYHLCWGWGFFSSSNFSVLFGNTWHSSFFWNDISPGADIENAEEYQLRNFEILCPTFRSCFGLQYDSDVDCDTKHVMVNVGLDGRYYFNLYPWNQQIAYGHNQIAFSKAMGSFGMIGVLINARIDF